MQNNRISILGVSIDDLTIETAVAKILDFIHSYPVSHRPQYVSTVNVDFFVKSLSWFESNPRYPELLDTLRNSSLCTADGMPIVWLSKFLGSPLKQRISGTDLFPLLLDTLAKENKKIYLLGGEAKSVKVTSILIDALYPGLTIAGYATPMIDVDGEMLANSHEEDVQLVEQINAASPDVLFISLGNPKQEIWFNRVKHRLKVPVSIGIGGTLEMTFGPVGRAPTWMQKSGLEWLYRLYKEPSRLWKRYLCGGIKFALQTIPLIFYHWIIKIESLLFPPIKLQPEQLQPPQLFLSENFSIASLKLPPTLGGKLFRKLRTFIDEASGHDALVLNFTDLSYLSPKHLSRLAELWKMAAATNKQLFAYGIKGGMQSYLKYHRLWDIFQAFNVTVPEEITASLPLKDHHKLLFISLHQQPATATISFLGRLHNEINYNGLQEKLMPIYIGKECVLDLSYCVDIENTGLSFLLSLSSNQPKERNPIQILNASKAIKNQFTLAKIEHLFTFVNNSIS